MLYKGLQQAIVRREGSLFDEGTDIAKRTIGLSRGNGSVLFAVGGGPRGREYIK